MLEVPKSVCEKAPLSFRASLPCRTSRGICLLHLNQAPDGLATSHTHSYTEEDSLFPAACMRGQALPSYTDCITIVR
jgi:hypothetical protein